MKVSLAEMRPFIAILLAILIVCLFGWTLAQAQTKYAAPNLSEYYASLMQPDNPSVGCCGWGDAYFAEKTDSCGPTDEVDCALVAIITDERPDVLNFPDGRTLTRPHIAVGTRISIPANKIRKKPIFNPTDRNIVFVAAPGGYTRVYCWEPAILG